MCGFASLVSLQYVLPAAIRSQMSCAVFKKKGLSKFGYF